MGQDTEDGVVLLSAVPYKQLCKGDVQQGCAGREALSRLSHPHAVVALAPCGL